MSTSPIRAALPRDANNNPIQAMKPDGSVGRTTSGTSATVTLPSNARIVRVETTAPAWIVFGASDAVAVTNGTSILLMSGDYFNVPQGATHLAAIQVADAGIVSITKMV
jgi:hypothetical protein